MARYIDVDKLCDSLRESYSNLFEFYKKAKDSDVATICEAELNTFLEFIVRAKTQPTADVEEVVRCKDCKKCEHCYPAKAKGEEPLEGWYCNTFKQWRNPDGFCSYGERRTDNG